MSSLLDNIAHRMRGLDNLDHASHAKGAGGYWTAIESAAKTLVSSVSGKTDYLLFSFMRVNVRVRGLLQWSE